MNFIEWLLFLWVFRKTPHSELMEIHVLVIKAARRCAYDLKHAAGALSYKNPEESKRYYQRARMWLDIFQPTGGKDYRHQMHSTISDLEFKLDKLREILKENNIEDPTIKDEIPF